MPMKAMIYETLSTVVDDLFAYALSLLRGMSKTDVNSHSIQLLYQDAIPSSFSLFPRWRGLSHFPVPGELSRPVSYVSYLTWFYQRWIYRIDPKRINEYGQVMEDVDAVQDKDGKDVKETKKDR